MTPNAHTSCRVLSLAALLLASQAIRCGGTTITGDQSRSSSGVDSGSGGTKSTGGAFATPSGGVGGSRNGLPPLPSGGDAGLVGTDVGKRGLQVYLKLDESTTSGAPRDASNHVAAVYGTVRPMVSPQSATVMFANPASLSFDGTATVDIPASENLRWTAGESFTMSLWAYPRALPLPANFAPLLSNQAGNLTSYCGIYIHDSGRWSFESNGSYRPNPEVLSASLVVQNKWQHVVIVQDAEAQTQRIYVDGVPGSIAATRAAAVCASSTPFSIGAKDGDGYVGLIDDVRIYGQALTEAQVKELASGKEDITP